MSFFSILSVKGENMKCDNRKVMIKVTNVDNKIQTEKEIRKHGNMLSISMCEIICGPSTVAKQTCC